MNKTCFIGRLTGEPMVKKVGEKQTSCLRYTIAVQRPGKDAGSDFIPCLTWGFEADYLANYAHKGTLISVTGELHTDSYEKDGVKRYTYEIRTDAKNGVKILGHAQNKGDKAVTGVAEQAPVEETVALIGDADLPF